MISEEETFEADRPESRPPVDREYGGNCGADGGWVGIDLPRGSGVDELSRARENNCLECGVTVRTDPGTRLRPSPTLGTFDAGCDMADELRDRAWCSL